MSDRPDSTYILSERGMELERENMEWAIDMIYQRWKDNHKRWEKEADDKLKELRAKGVSLV